MAEYPDIGPSLPMVPLGPQDLGLPPPPVAPAAPSAPEPGMDPKARILKLIALGIAGGLGPGAGTGLLQGMNLADQRQAQERQRSQAMANQQYQQARQTYGEQQRSYTSEQSHRQQTLAQNIAALRKTAGEVSSKEEYDQQVDAFTTGLQSMGYRVNANFLRSSAPYIAPDVPKRAQKAMDAFLKNPVNKALIENHPERIAETNVLFERQGVGKGFQSVPLTDLAVMAGMPFGTDANGKLITYPKGTSTEMKANADGILQTLTEQAMAEGQHMTPALQLELQQKAIKMAAEAKPDTTDPALAEIRRIELERLKNQPKDTLPTHLQQQILNKSKAFDAQPAVKNTQLMSEAVGFAQSLDINTKNPADDIGLIYAFAKAMDPNSVVREGEYATVQRYAQSWAEQFEFNAKRIFSNTAFLTPQARANMKATIASKFRAGQKQYDVIRKSYADQINRMTGLNDGEDRLTDYGGAFPSDAPGLPADSSGAEERWIRDPKTGKLVKQ